MSEETIVKMDERGRLTIPQGVRVALGVNGDESWVRVRLDVVEPNEGP